MCIFLFLSRGTEKLRDVMIQVVLYAASKWTVLPEDDEGDDLDGTPVLPVSPPITPSTTSSVPNTSTSPETSRLKSANSPKGSPKKVSFKENIAESKSIAPREWGDVSPGSGPSSPQYYYPAPDLGSPGPDSDFGGVWQNPTTNGSANKNDSGWSSASKNDNDAGQWENPSQTATEWGD